MKYHYHGRLASSAIMAIAITTALCNTQEETINERARRRIENREQKRDFTLTVEE